MWELPFIHHVWCLLTSLAVSNSLWVLPHSFCWPFADLSVTLFLHKNVSVLYQACLSFTAYWPFICCFSHQLVSTACCVLFSATDFFLLVSVHQLVSTISCCALFSFCWLTSLPAASLAHQSVGDASCSSFTLPADLSHHLCSPACRCHSFLILFAICWPLHLLASLWLSHFISFLCCLLISLYLSLLFRMWMLPHMCMPFSACWPLSCSVCFVSMWVLLYVCPVC